ncbi:YggT family protein [Acuticoccus sp. MNP-M23]|uniref:YggT family protein n=1 Tax=Acuticoccus sp. MNP-M23 TaxID=3072793 RepID=UPI0028151248|nr:YggT family protein [Acuticoccus sp. MNP-M23]WMS44867.1 YggT family protein [Acuticoccus sp. MNP-M23]
MASIITLLLTIIEMYTWIVIASAVFSWLYAFNVVNPRNQFISTVGNVLYRLTEPVLGRIRSVLPAMGGLDLSPLLLLLGLFFLRVLIINNAGALIG